MSGYLGKNIFGIFRHSIINKSYIGSFLFIDLPKVTEQSKNDFKNLPVILKGDDVRLECKAQGNPATTYYVWRWENGTVIQNKTTGILEFKNIQPYEGGRLSCAGGSYIGEGEKVQVNISVQGKAVYIFLNLINNS